MRSVGAAVLILVLTACSSMTNGSSSESRAPERHVQGTHDLLAPSSYPLALQLWRTPEQINAWIAARFEYDTQRGMLLSESGRALKDPPVIYAPEAFFGTPKGVCVDLSRFAVETLREVAPELEANYVLIEFEPMIIAGHTVRLHWVVSFERSGMRYFFADSNRPGHIAGPYSTTQEYITEYSQYRGRRIVSFRELPSYQRRLKTPAHKQSRENAAPDPALERTATLNGKTRCEHGCW